MAVHYTKKKEEIPDNTFNAVEYFERAIVKRKEAELPEKPKIENTK